jgi:hypothetical protein
VAEQGSAVPGCAQLRLDHQPLSEEEDELLAARRTAIVRPNPGDAGLDVAQRDDGAVPAVRARTVAGFGHGGRVHGLALEVLDRVGRDSEPIVQGVSFGGLSSRARVSAASVSHVIVAFVAAIHVSIAGIHSSTASLALTKLSAVTGSKMTPAGVATAVPPAAVRKRSIHPGATIYRRDSLPTGTIQSKSPRRPSGG